MTERTDLRSMDALERDLRALATSIDWPATPDMRAAVRTRITAPATPRLLRPSPFRLTRPLLFAIVLLALLAAVAAAVILGLPGLRITVVDTLPTPNVPAVTGTPPPNATPPASVPANLPGSNLQLGRAVSLAEATRVLGTRILLPDLPGTDEPDAVYLERIDGVPVVTLTWGVRPDLPPATAGSDVGLLITQFEATIDQGLMTKALDQGATVEAVRVGAHRALWISGDAHILFFRRAGQNSIESLIRLVGDTLAVEWDGQIVRLESSLGKVASLDLAATLR